MSLFAFGNVQENILSPFPAKGFVDVPCQFFFFILLPVRLALHLRLTAEEAAPKYWLPDHFDRCSDHDLIDMNSSFPAP